MHGIVISYKVMGDRNNPAHWAYFGVVEIIQLTGH